MITTRYTSCEIVTNKVLATYVLTYVHYLLFLLTLIGWAVLSNDAW